MQPVEFMSFGQHAHNVIHFFTNVPGLHHIDYCSSFSLLAQVETASTAHAAAHGRAMRACICSGACWRVWLRTQAAAGVSRGAGGCGL